MLLTPCNGLAVPTTINTISLSGVAKIELTRPWHIDGGVFIFRNGPTRIFGRVLKTG